MISSMNYIPTRSKLPHLRVPENRVRYAFYWYKMQRDNPMNFACYSYWIQRCKNDGSDY